MSVPRLPNDPIEGLGVNPAEVAYYSEAAAGLGERFTEAVEEASALALAFPLAGSPSDANTRRVFTKGFPFSIIYLKMREFWYLR
jgi:hypothetical protein